MTQAQAKRRIVGKHIRHSPNVQIPSKIQQDTTFLVKSSTPYISALKQITKIINKFDKLSKGNARFKSGDYKKVQYITVKGMGKCIPKTLSLALAFQKNQLKVDIHTGSQEVLDEFEVCNENMQGECELQQDGEKSTLFKKRMVSYVELRIWIKRGV